MTVPPLSLVAQGSTHTRLEARAECMLLSSNPSSDRKCQPAGLFTEQAPPQARSGQALLPKEKFNHTDKDKSHCCWQPAGERMGEELPWLCSPELLSSVKLTPRPLDPWCMQKCRKGSCCSQCLLNVRFALKDEICPQWQRGGQADCLHSDTISACPSPQLSRDYLRKSQEQGCIWSPDGVS